MPTQLAVGNILQLTQYWYYGAAVQLGEVVTHYKVTSVVGFPWTLEQAGAALDLRLAAPCAALVPSAVIYYGIDLRRLNPLPLVIYQRNASSTGGTYPGSAFPLPSQCRGLVQKRGTVLGKGKKGRSYLPFIPYDALQANNTLVTDYATAMQTWINVCLTAVVTLSQSGDVTELTSIILKRPASAAQPNLLDAARINLKVATQRRSGAFGRVNALPF